MCDVILLRILALRTAGYPAGLKGEQTPLEGRIVMIVDQYDALRNRRVYKSAFDHATTCDIILNGDGRTLSSHFAPRILAAFKEIKNDFAEIFDKSQGDESVCQGC